MTCATRLNDSPLPGDISPAEAVRRMIRVDHAGEYGAARIYRGQLAVLSARGKTPESVRVIREMAAQEEEHLDRFNALVRERRVRPSALLPLWHVGGFALGAATALLGEKAAMACTVAVESVIDAHYAAQEQALPAGEEELGETIARFRADEAEHHDTGLAHGAEDAPFYHALHGAVSAITRGAIWLSTRV